MLALWTVGKEEEKSYIPETSKLQQQTKTVNKELISKFLSGRRIDEKVSEYFSAPNTSMVEEPAIGFY